MRRFLALLLLVHAASLFAAPLSLEVTGLYPNQIHLTWEAVEGADYYDLYLDGKPMARTTDAFAVLGSNEESLLSHTGYQIIVAARKRGDIDLAAGMKRVVTPGWEGRYRWENVTGDDNKGKCRHLDFTVVWKDGSYEVYAQYERMYRIFPLVPDHLIGEEVSWDGDEVYQLAYRANAEVFNTTSYKPKSWSVTKLERGADILSVEVRTRVGSLRFTTRSRYTFALSPKGEALLFFETKGDGLASWGLFQSPNPGEKGVFGCVFLGP
ncbi:MAG: hypothetical protein EOM01_04520 [Spirochaetia bacterium]|nr:hypothetical protein [Spirochaetia bacterium]